jgi:hypothetical protein
MKNTAIASINTASNTCQKKRFCNRRGSKTPIFFYWLIVNFHGRRRQMVMETYLAVGAIVVSQHKCPWVKYINEL